MLISKVYGAYSYDVEYILNGGAPFKFSPGVVTSNRWDTRWAADGWVYVPSSRFLTVGPESDIKQIRDQSACQCRE